MGRINLRSYFYSARFPLMEKSPTITVAYFFHQITECMRSEHFFRTTKLLDLQPETHLS